ncbi:L-threonylcarbamoyladenylate synthase [Lederbergia sp. NSJ-179]|uniref:L-threonylcarbamoyladenylate synthase n=1 Tax=Lederbergia sp. NSJ-179 TaxID=2931402 RepID=UPI001FD4CC06|nr:L-threonylcarbamoyladenylate synthase [Lederbergia sp. NSJ-179]MCJ7840562.1 L-threonylcarbamoyladenylate synthase [Lederbergia sp. NSJ-179]
MNTIHWSVEKNVDNLDRYPQIVEAAQYLSDDQVVAFPTETVYGLGANAYSDKAVAQIFAAKGRPADNPLIVHIAEYQQLEKLVIEVSEQAKLLIKAFWPGPLTLIFPRKPGILSELVTAGLDTVAIRMPSHPIALALIRTSGLPIAAPSANRSGKPSPTTAQHVEQDLSGKIAGIVDGGAAGVGLESTVLDCTGQKPVILRPGDITKEEMEVVLSNKMSLASNVLGKSESPRAPGMKYKHYSPNAPLYLVDGESTWIQSLIKEKREQGVKVGVLASTETKIAYDADLVLDCGSRKNLAAVARQLYDNLRKFDQTGVDLIFAEVFPKSGVGVAIMNRLEKAAGHHWIFQKDQS